MNKNDMLNKYIQYAYAYSEMKGYSITLNAIKNLVAAKVNLSFEYTTCDIEDIVDAFVMEVCGDSYEYEEEYEEEIYFESEEYEEGEYEEEYEQEYDIY